MQRTSSVRDGSVGAKSESVPHYDRENRKCYGRSGFIVVPCCALLAQKAYLAIAASTHNAATSPVEISPLNLEKRQAAARASRRCPSPDNVARARFIRIRPLRISRLARPVKPEC